MHAAFLKDVFQANAEKDALIWRGNVVSYATLLESVDRWRRELAKASVEPGTVTTIEGDFSPDAVSLLVALIDLGCIVVPLTSTVETKKPEFRDIAQVELTIRFNKEDSYLLDHVDRDVTQRILLDLKSRGNPGLVLFSSGSTGKNKAAVHDFVPLLDKFRVERHSLRTITFLLFDHIGGVNTLLYNLSNAGCIVTIQDRRPEAVCAAIEKHGVELLPTSPSFLNLLLVSEAYRRHDLSSLKLVTYGTEVMPQSTLERFHSLFPDVRLLQTYGLSELGILRSKSKSSDSLWVKIGGEGFETRVVDGLLEIRARSAMLGYLNAPSPFTEDGWFKTGDCVEEEDGYFRFLGRDSEIINVGGEKVYPAEVESALQRLPGVADVMVNGEPNALLGQIVVAHVNLEEEESLAEFRKRMRSYCKERLAPYKIPQKVVVVDRSLHGDRFKKIRAPGAV
jgi:acyl-coenzyme A synthetase/AMP-(fatty) acid ligase